MTDYHVAVLSYQRPNEVCGKTIKMLVDGGVPKSAICVYVHASDPYVEAYVDNLELLDIECAVTDTIGTKQQRAEVYSRFPEGHHIVSVDDDIKGLMTFTEDLETGKKSKALVTDVDSLFKEMFEVTRDHNLFAWGLYIPTNPFFMKDRCSTGLRPFGYGLFGVINRPGHIVHDFTTKYCDDMEFCLRSWWWDGGVVRNDGVAFLTEIYTDGGLNAAGRDASGIYADNVNLKRQWGEFVKFGEGSHGVSWVKIRPRQRDVAHSADTLPPGLSALADIL